MNERYQVIGVESSPYSVKLRAVLRYRRIPHDWLCRMPQFHPPTADVKPPLMPVLRHPDGTYRVDSTPIILDLEDRHEGRSVIPDDPLAAFFCRLIEDMADEWLTKCVFHYRFAYDADRAYAPQWVMDDTNPGIADDALDEKSAEFLKRQSERMALVGAVPGNTLVIEGTLHRVLDILGPFAALDRFLFGSRPSLADFGLFGQLKTLCTDPTSAALIRSRVPRLEHWVRRADDLSGVEGEWRPWHDAVVDLLGLAGDTYLPFLAANAEAIDKGKDEVSADLRDGPYRQTPFKYQAKCYDTLRTLYGDLTAAQRLRADLILEQTGCLAFLI